jgi:Zn-dependent alcohol dehydrogenase
MSLGTGQQLLDGVRACLKTKPERPFADGYTADAFAKRTTVSGVDKFIPVSIPIERVGSQLCGKITDVGAFFCPARVAADWETATVDVGSNECPIVDVIAAAKDDAIIVIQEEAEQAERDGQTDEADDDLIEGLDEASGIGVVAAAALLACCCGSCCAGWCWVRRRRQKQAAAVKANAASAASNHALPPAQP